MRLTKQKTNELFVLATDRYTRWYDHTAIMSIDDGLVNCLKKYLPIIETVIANTLQIKLYDTCGCGIYKLRDRTSEYISNYHKFLKSNNIKYGYIEANRDDWDNISDYNDTEVASLIINSNGYFYYELISFLDEDGGVIIYDTEPLNVRWFLENYEQGLFGSDA